MAKLWAILLLALCTTQAITAARIVRNADPAQIDNITEGDLIRIRNANITIDQFRQIQAQAAEEEADQELTPEKNLVWLAKLCEILNPDQKASAVNVTPVQQQYLHKFKDTEMKLVVNEDVIRFIVSAFRYFR